MARKQSFFRGVFLSDWRNKVFALSLSLVVWFLAYNAQKNEATFDYDVLVYPTDRAVIRVAIDDGSLDGAPFSNRIRVSFQGQRGDLDKFRTQSGQLLATFSADWVVSDPDGPPGTGLLRLDRLDAFDDIPEGFSITGCEPSVLRCWIEDIVTVEKVVTPVISAPNKATLVARVGQVHPERVRITCPEGAAETAVVYTERVIVGDKKSDFSEDVPLFVQVDPQYQELSDLKEVGQVRVHVEVRPSTTVKEIQLTIEYHVFDGFGVSGGSKKPGSFVFRGPEAALDELKRKAELGEVKVFARMKQPFSLKRSEEQRAETPGDFYFVGLPENVEFMNVRGTVQYEIVNLEHREEPATKDEDQ